PATENPGAYRRPRPQHLPAAGYLDAGPADAGKLDAGAVRPLCDAEEVSGPAARMGCTTAGNAGAVPRCTGNPAPPAPSATATGRTPAPRPDPAPAQADWRTGRTGPDCGGGGGTSV